jgi:hypothetical protein
LWYRERWVLGTRTCTHTGSIWWVIIHTHAHTKNAGFYPIRYEYFLGIPIEHVSNCRLSCFHPLSIKIVFDMFNLSSILVIFGRWFGRGLNFRRWIPEISRVIFFSSLILQVVSVRDAPLMFCKLLYSLCPFL